MIQPLQTALVGLVTSLLIVLVAFAAFTPPVITVQASAVQTSARMPGFADALDMITNLLDRGRGIEAENVSRALLARVESTLGPEVLEVAEVLDLLGRAVRRSSKVKDEEKRVFAERAVAIKERVLGPWHAHLATSLTNLAIHETLTGNPAGAKPPLERALAIREKAFGSDHVSVAATVQSLAGVLMTIRDDAGAVRLLERALRIRESTYGAAHIETIHTQFKIAVFYAEIHDYNGARQHYERALRLSEQSLGESHPLVFEILLRLAEVISDGAGDYAGSARLNERLLAAAARSFGPSDPRLRLPLRNLAIDRLDLGDYPTAKTHAERALAITERAFGSTHREVADSLHTLATVLAAQGDYSEAMKLFERATRIGVAVSRSPNPEVSRAGWFIRELFPVSGYGADDAVLFEQAVAIREKDRGLIDRRTADILTNLVAVLSSADDYRRTHPLFERALKSLEDALGPDHPAVAAAATNLAVVLSQVGGRDAAQLLYERALNIYEKSLGPEHPRVATALLKVAQLYSNARRYHDARPLVARALMIQQQKLGPDHPDMAATLTSLAALSGYDGSATEAFTIAARAERLSREHMRLTARTLSERQALAYASSRASALDLMLSVMSTRPGDSQATTAFDAVIGARGIVLDEMAARHRVASTTEDPATATLSRALASARQRLAATVVRGVGDTPPERYRDILDHARSEKERAERDLAEKSERFRDDQLKSGAGLVELSAALPPDAALIAYVRYSHQYFQGSAPITEDAQTSYLAFVLRRGDTGPAVVPIGSAAKIDALILQWRRQIEQESMAAGRTSPRTETAYRQVAAQLRQQIWDPLAPHLSQVSRVFIVPDGPLHLVSFAALPTVASQYLVETGPLIHYLSAERDLVPAESGRGAGVGLLALGGPAFDEHVAAPPPASTSFRGDRSVCVTFQATRYDPLPASVQEVDQVVTLWNTVHRLGPAAPSPATGDQSQPHSTRLTGAEASESAFKAEATGRRVLHLATHGFFLSDRCTSADPTPSMAMTASARIARENPLLLSGLVLAGANHRNAAAPDQEDGVLTAEEVAALNLTGVEWAVLSGCDTGIGEVRAGEGVFGLRRAFHVAGVKTVIMSLWAVEDQATRQWMATLYESRLVHKASTTDAVREATLSALQQRRNRGLSTHPFHWAAFVAAGDWR